MAIAQGIGRAMLPHRAFPQREREELAAHVERHAVSGGMEVVLAEEVARRHELARRLRAVRAYVDLEALGSVARRVEQPHIGAALVDDALAVGRGIARVEVLV